MKYLSKTDPEIAHLIKLEEKRQAETLMMIPSENIVSKSVEEAVGSVLMNKYAEGYPFKRYYQGQEFVDQVETLVVERAKKLFGVPYVNVQPHSGSPANLAVYTALLQPHDTVMGLSLAFGGHLTHGASASATSVFFRSVQYQTNKKGVIDYDELEKLAKKEKPKIIVAGATAYPRVFDWERFAKIATSIGAFFLADISHVAGLIVGKAYPSPTPYADIITTTTHKTLRGPRGAIIMVTDKGLKKDPDLGKKISKAVFPGLQGGPHIHTIAGIGVALKEASTKNFQKYTQQIIANNKVLGDELIKYKFDVISDGTDSNLLLIDLTNKKQLLGNTVAEALEKGGIVTNRNAVPFDPNPPFYPSGLRLGSPGITSRGMKEKEMKLIASWINEIVNDLQKAKAKTKLITEDEKKRDNRKALISQVKSIPKIHQAVKSLCQKFPIKKEY